MTGVTLQGKPVRLDGAIPETGRVAPPFSLVSRALKDRTLDDFAGQGFVMSVVPSLDTSVCAASARRLDEMAADRRGLLVVFVSADLPFAQKRFCDEAGLSHLSTLSTMRGREFAHDYGLAILDGPLAGLTARAVFVIDGQGVVRYRELVDEITDEPDYAALEAFLDDQQALWRAS